MTNWTPQNPGLEEHSCAKLDAHGPHEWEWNPIGKVVNPPVMVWCRGVRAHANTMIGQSRG